MHDTSLAAWLDGPILGGWCVVAAQVLDVGEPGNRAQRPLVVARVVESDASINPVISILVVPRPGRLVLSLLYGDPDVIMGREVPDLQKLAVAASSSIAPDVPGFVEVASRGLSVAGARAVLASWGLGKEWVDHHTLTAPRRAPPEGKP